MLSEIIIIIIKFHYIKDCYNLCSVPTYLWFLKFPRNHVCHMKNKIVMRVHALHEFKNHDFFVLTIVITINSLHFAVYFFFIIYAKKCLSNIFRQLHNSSIFIFQRHQVTKYKIRQAALLN